MSEVDIETAMGQVLAVLDEGFKGPERFAYFSDHGDDAGLFRLLEKIDAATASKAGRGSSLAAQVSHLIFAMNASRLFIEGTQRKFDWSTSWVPSSVDEESWTTLKESLGKAYNELRSTIASRGSADLPSLGASFGAAAHVAYHLGAMRQKYLH